MHSDSTRAGGHVLYRHVHEKPLPRPYRCQGPVYNTVQRYRIDVLFVVITTVACQVQRHAPPWTVTHSLTRHVMLDLTEANSKGKVHCFRHTIVGLRAN